MKLKAEKKEFNITGIGVEEKEFSIDTNSDMIIKLLRDKMYKNKIGAVCREVISNSRDANRENDKKHTPVKVELIHNKSYVSEEYSISFSDEGIGISPDRMDNIFLKYGSSTKRETNEYTGGFGIGAKTPFAYTDEFFINTVVNVAGENVLFQYQALIISDGSREVSKMILINKEKTTQQTGTKITIPIQEEDIEEFEKELIYTTSFWGVKPHFIGFEFKNLVKEIEIVHKQKEFMFMKERKYNNIYGDSSYIILIDEIPYIFDNNKLLEINENLSFIIQDNFKFVLKFNTGEITVSGSREDIEYTKENIKKIIQRNNLIISEGEKMIREKIEQASSYSEACKNASQIFNYERGYKGVRINHFITKGVFEFLALIYHNNKKINPEDYKYKNQEVFYRLGFYNYLFIKVINKGGKMMKDSILSTCFSHKDWELPKYLFDVRQQNNLQGEYLKEKHSNGYVLVFDVSEMSENQIKTFHKYQTYSDDSIRRVKSWKKSKREEKEIIEKLNLNITPYSEVPKLKKESNKVKKENVDYIKLPIKEYVSKKRVWESKTINFYKDKNTTDEDDFENIKKVAWFKVNSFSLSELKKDTDFKTISGMDLGQTIKAKILIALGYTIITCGQTKEKYIKQLGIKSIEKIFNELTENSDNLKEAVQYVLTLKLNLGSETNCEFLSNLNFDSKYKEAFKLLEKDLNKTYDKIEKNHIIKDFVRILDYAENDFFDVFQLERKKEIDLFSQFINENPLIDTVLKIEDEEYNFSTSTRKKEDSEKVLNSMRNQILNLFEKNN
jgi:hypothetical protein